MLGAARWAAMVLILAGVSGGGPSRFPVLPPRHPDLDICTSSAPHPAGHRCTTDHRCPAGRGTCFGLPTSTVDFCRCHPAPNLLQHTSLVPGILLTGPVLSCTALTLDPTPTANRRGHLQLCRDVLSCTLSHLRVAEPHTQHFPRPIDASPVLLHQSNRSGVFGLYAPRCTRHEDCFSQ
jgi:hypothetical protein